MIIRSSYLPLLSLRSTAVSAMEFNEHDTEQTLEETEEPVAIVIQTFGDDEVEFQSDSDIDRGPPDLLGDSEDEGELAQQQMPTTATEPEAPPTTSRGRGRGSRGCASSRAGGARGAATNRQWSWAQVQNEAIGEPDTPSADTFQKAHQFEPAGIHGATFPISASQLHSPIHYFDQMFAPDLRRKIVTETNAHFNSQLRDLPPELQEKKRAAYTTLDFYLLNIFIAVLILFGLRQIPSDRLAWTSRLAYEFPAITKIMNRDTFHRIKNTLHFGDNSAPGAKDDACHKFRLLLEAADSFLRGCVPGEFIGYLSHR